MSSDSDQTPQAGKRKKFLFPVSEDSDDSDYSIVQLRTRKKVFRVISEDESSGEEPDFRTNENDANYESSGSNTCTQKMELGESSEDSDWQSDWTSSSDVESEKQQPIKRKVVGKKKLTNPITSSPEVESESSGDEHAEKCPICLLPFRKQQIGNPSSCEHCFCLECLVEWSKNINTCPVDRQTFTFIHVRNALGGNIVKHVPVEVAPRVEDQVQEDPTFCEVCHQCDREDRMLLCDGCDSGYHLECLTPPMDEVPMGEWFCPECSQNSQNDAEAVDIDLDEISDLMEEARRLGVSYGRTRTGGPNENQVRIVPRTRHTERVRAIIRSRARICENPRRAREQTFDPSQPSTSSGLDSYGDNSRSRSPSNTSNFRSARKPTSRGNKTSKTTKKHSSRNSNTVVREVRITEYNEDGEEEEIVTYVKVAVGRKSRGGRSRRITRRRRKTTKYRRQVRKARVSSGRKRLARSLGICKPARDAKLLVPVVKSKSSVSDRTLSLSRYRSGINQVSLFGTGLGLDYSPPGSDAEEDYSVSSGAVISVQRRSLLASNRRRVNLKTISNPISIEEPEVVDILSSIISSQETWHSKKSSAVLKADGLVVVEKKEDENPSKNGSSPKKEKKESTEETISRTGTPIEVSNINPNDITQAPMYNNPCGGGNRGNFRGGYRDNGRHSHGGQNYSRDSISGGGRHSYGGSGARDNFGNRDFGPPAFYNPNFEQCGPPMFAGNPPFRGRNPQNFRNERFRFPPPERHQFNFNEGFERHPFERFPRPRLPPPPGPPERSQNNFPPTLPEDTLRGLPNEQPERVNAQTEAEVSSSSLTRPDDDCDIYCDIETTNKDCDAQETEQTDSTALLPPPEPPSSLLDFDENSKSDKDSDQELVIDDSHKDDTPKADKYDPFAADSDTNDSDKVKKDSEQSDTTLPKDLPPTGFAGTSNIVHPPVPPSPSVPIANRDSSGIRLTAYDDDDDEDSQADCPNFSIYSSQTMDVARHTEQELSQQIGPLEPPPLPPSIPDDDDIIVRDVQACDLADIPEPSDPYVEALRKERQALSKIPPKKISHDSRGKITFKIGNKLKLNNRLTTLHDDKDTVEKEEKPANEVRKEETIVDEAPIIRDEERRKIASGKVSEDEEDTSVYNEDKEEKDKESVNDISNDIEQEESIAEMPPSPAFNKVGEESKMVVDEDVSESSKPIEIAETSSDNELPTTDTLQYSPRRVEVDLDADSASDDESEESKPVTPVTSKIDEEEERENDDDDDEDDEERNYLKTDDHPDDVDSEKDSREAIGLDRLEDEEIEQFPIEKDPKDEDKHPDDADAQKEWESDGAYTPCKDELPIREGKSDPDVLESGLEPITPTKDKLNDDLDGCRTPADYAGLGTEAISETDEPLNFEDELALLNMRKEKEMEDGEILDESKSAPKDEKSKSKEDDSKKKKKKDKKEKSKETEKNKENISSDNQVAWKKLSKSTKERPYRDKDRRSKSKEKDKEREKDKDKDKEKEKDKDKDKEKSKKKGKEVVKKKEKRKEMPRYDVRKIVAEKPARPRKDEYGRDIREKSRSRSRSRSSSRLSFSRDRRSRSYSKARSRSRSRLRIHRSWSRDHRSYSKSYRSLSRRRSLSRGRRKSPKRRSGSRRRSLSRRQSVSRRRSRSPSRKRRSLSPRRRSRRRSLSKSRDRRKDKSKKYKSRSRSRNRKRSRSKSPKRLSKSREKKHSKRKLQSRSRSKGRSCSRDRNRNWDQMSEKLVEHEQHFSRERERDERDSWSAQWTPSWSRSRSKSLPPMQQEPMTSREWSPSSVLDTVSVPPKNLTVILTNKEAIKKKKKERRKESKKSKETEKKRKGKRNRTPPPSKEVFASGDNILVSVCFNKDNETSQPPVPELPETIPLMPPVKRRRRDTLPSEPPKRSKKEKTKDKRSKSPKPKKDKKKKSKAAEIAATKKPVAVIDLDQSPFREQTPSPRDVIVLSDDDDKQVQEVATPEQRPPSQESPPREQFVSQGPKTPPEPQIKFSINKQPSNLRPSMLNPLLEEEEEEEMDERAEEELEMRAQEELELRLKIGPNTPPEPPTSPPTSPDVYDPFDPTKSRSPTPDASQEATPNDDRDRNRRGSPRKHDSVDVNLQEEPAQQPDRQSQEKQVEKPKIISMVTIKRASPQRDTSPANEVDVDTTTSANSPPKSQQNQQAVQSTSNPFATINPVLATVAAAVQRSGVFNAAAPNSTQRNLLQANRISPSNQPKQQQQQQQGVFANSGKASRLAKTGQGKSQAAMGQNGNDTGLETTENVDMSSPYSPGSTLSDGIFDPPSPTNFTNSPIMGATVSTTTTQLAKNNATKITKTSADKKDAFDQLFGAAPPSKPTSKPARNNKKSDKSDKKKKSTNPKVGVRMDENQLQILDDLPSSAVEMQVKDKFLKKLNRQERVVEEVKLVLKPHYTKKHVTKEEYKDIMRKAVPKICHNKTGEINPKKIAHLIEAYVKKCRGCKKKPAESSGSKISKTSKTLWS